MHLNIAVLPGDGIGKEVTEVALRVTEAICLKFGHRLFYKHAPVGVTAMELTGSPYPEETHKICMDADAVLFGAVGSSHYDNAPTAKLRPEHGLLAIRKRLGLYANLRPIYTYTSLLEKSPLKPDVISGSDFICVRELTGGLYFGTPQGRSEDGNTAYDTCVYHRYEIERILDVAYQLAIGRRKKVTVVDKANILATSRLWREIARQKATCYPDIETEYLFVDNAAMCLMERPRDFDVIVTENTFGDILTDEAAVITGSLGLLPSASIGLHTSLFEPIHGSYPQAAGKNIANPLASVLSAAMMFDHAFSLHAEARTIREVVKASIDSGNSTADICPDGKKPLSTSAVGDWLCTAICNA